MQAVQRSNSVAVYAFSADPITYGHINIVERMARCFDHCIVGIGRNPLKRYLFSLEERTTLAKQALAFLPNVEVKSFDGMVVDFAYEQGAHVIVKGVRNATDVDYEQNMHQVGVSQQMGIDTHILFADPKLGHVSSSAVKAMQMEHGFIHDYVPPMVKAALEAKISGQLVIGLSGSIASGKSTLARALIEAGAVLGMEVHDIDLDHLGHQLLAGENIGEPLYLQLKRQLVEHFGSALVESEKIVRERLAELIFANDQARLTLNSLMEKPMSLLLRRALKDKKGLILLNGALLPDLNLMGLCNFRCILTDVSLPEQQHRLIQRGHTPENANERICAQKDGMQKRALIHAAMQAAGSGKLWEANDFTPMTLLQTLLHDCPEAAWLTQH